MKEILETEAKVDTYQKSTLGDSYGYIPSENNVVIVKTVEDQENLVSLACLGGFITVKGVDLIRAIQKCLM